MGGFGWDWRPGWAEGVIPARPRRPALPGSGLAEGTFSRPPLHEGSHQFFSWSSSRIPASRREGMAIGP